MSITLQRKVKAHSERRLNEEKACHGAMVPWQRRSEEVSCEQEHGAIVIISQGIFVHKNVLLAK